jgi:hypothetical protein
MRAFALILCVSFLASPAAAKKDEKATLIREIRAANVELKGFGYLEISKKRWCIVSVDAELMEATTGQSIGETYFGSYEEPVCRTLWVAARQNLRVDLTGIPERAVTERVFVGSMKKIYPIGFVWVRIR